MINSFFHYLYLLQNYNLYDTRLPTLLTTMSPILTLLTTIKKIVSNHMTHRHVSRPSSPPLLKSCNERHIDENIPGMPHQNLFDSFYK